MDGLKIHKTRPHKVKREDGDWEQVNIDVKIIPVVDWLNSYKHIRTEYSCQGDEIIRPYIIFYCNRMEEFSSVTNSLHKFALDLSEFCPENSKHWIENKEDGIETEFDYFYGGPRFVIRWKNSGQLRRFIKFLKGK